MKVYLSAPHSNNFLDGMKIFLAGAATGNNNAIWRNNTNNPNNAFKKLGLMDIYLAGTHAEKTRANANNDFAQKIYVLESFYYMQDWMLPYIKNHWHFLLDSGAFTFMNNVKKNNNVNWDEYLERYAKFINDYNIDLFFELDIDSIVGIKEVERLRHKLERLTNKKSIPVWHKSRGLEYWKRMVKDYDYVAIGGIVTKEIKRTEYAIFGTLLKIAKQNKCQVHGLGFTNMEGLKKYPFDSVDSTAWIYGNRGGFLYNFNGKDFDKIQVPKGKRLNGKKVAIHNFKEWIKFQRYAENNL